MRTNLVETAVRETHRTLLRRNADFCPCQRCADDVVTYVLNHSRPRYATSSKGWALENLELFSDQGRAELAVMVFDAMRRVADKPRHDPDAATEPSGS